MTIAADLDKAVRAVCPIVGVSIGRMNDKATWRIDFADDVTDEQRAAAASALASFDPTVIELEKAFDPVAKLRAFLDQNQDVKALIG